MKAKKAKAKRRILAPKMTISYKLPVIKEGGQEFYEWINQCEKRGYKSLNSLITEALKLKYMVDQLNTKDIQLGSIPRNANSSGDLEPYRDEDDENIIVDVADIEEFSFDISRTFESIKRNT